MWILPLLGYLGVIVGFAFLTLAIASGLYYLSELVEEHTVQARRLLTRLIYAILIIHLLLLLLDRFPFLLTLFSITSHLVYACNLRRFPIVKLSDPIFVLSCVLVGLNHWFWFRHFSKPPVQRASSSSSSSSSNWRQPYQYQLDMDDLPTFTEVASFFGLCVWLVPFALFVSLSAGENILPSMGSEYATGERVPTAGLARGGGMSSDGKTKSRGMAKALVDNVRDWVKENGAVMGFWRGEHLNTF